MKTADLDNLDLFDAWYENDPAMMPFAQQTVGTPPVEAGV